MAIHAASMSATQAPAGDFIRRDSVCHVEELGGVFDAPFRRVAGVLLLLVALLLSGCDSSRKIETLTPEQAAAQSTNPVPGCFLSIAGAKIFYRDSEPGGDAAHTSDSFAASEGSTVVLIHGLGASTFSFRRNFPGLARQARVLALDLKGFGFSKEFSDRDVSFEAQARLVVEFLDALKIRRATLIGHSLGGTIAALIAAQHPDRVDRLVLIDSATLYVTRPFVTRFLHGRLFNGLAYQWGGPNRRRVRKLLMKSYADRSKVTPADVEGYYFPFTVKNSAESLRLFLTTNNPNLNAWFARIQVPTLILWGKEDTFIEPSVRDFLHQQIKTSRVVTIAGAGHAVMEEQPDLVNREIIAFLKGQ